MIKPVNVDAEIKMKGWVGAAAATERLGISRATLYAYVSRGLIRSSAVAGSRERRYASEDVERLRNRAEDRRDPSRIAEKALHWGGPVLESAITRISDGRLFYRGHEATELARERSIEEVASLIWTGSFEAAGFASTPLHVVAGGKNTEGLPFINRAQSILPLVAARDPLAFDLRARSVAQTGWRILNLLASVAADSSNLAASVEETLQRAWASRDKRAAEAIRHALIMCADHELNVSSFTARCVASAGSNPYAVVLAGMAAIEGIKHGGTAARIETMLDELQKAKDIRATMGDRLRRGEAIHGFGHRLYPDGDPRAAFLLDQVRDRFTISVMHTAEDLIGEKPTIDFALVVMSRALKLPRGSALTLFALGRTIGWIGHAIEQYARDEIIRPRARYVGPRD
jgi:citrate synthase